MSNIIKIEEQLKDAMAEYRKAEEELGSWKEKWGKKLDELWKEGEKKREEREYLMNEKKKLEEKEKNSMERRDSWDALYKQELLGGKGNEQIAEKKIIFHSFNSIYLFIIIRLREHLVYYLQ